MAIAIPTSMQPQADVQTPVAAGNPKRPLTQAEIEALARMELGSPTLLMSGGQMQSNMARPSLPQQAIPTSMDTIPFTTDLAGPAGQYSAEHAARVKQYQDELDSAERFWKQQQLQAALESGISPTKAPSVGKKQFLKSGNDIWEFDPFTGTSKLAVQGAEEPTKKQFRTLGDQIFSVDPITGQANPIAQKPEEQKAYSKEQIEAMAPEIKAAGGVARPHPLYPERWTIYYPPPNPYAELLREADPLGSENAATTPAAKSKGEYVIGKSYRGMVYLGGDPSKESSWR